MVFANLLAVTIPQILEKDTNEQGKMAKGHPIKIFPPRAPPRAPQGGSRRRPRRDFVKSIKNFNLGTRAKIQFSSISGSSLRCEKFEGCRQTPIFPMVLMNFRF